MIQYYQSTKESSKEEMPEHAPCEVPYYMDDKGHVYSRENVGDTPAYLGTLFKFSGTTYSCHYGSSLAEQIEMRLDYLNVFLMY